MLTLAQPDPDKREGNEGPEQHIEFVVAGEDPPEALKAAEESFDMVALSIDLLVQPPRPESLGIRWDDRTEAQKAGEAAGFVALIGHVHDQGATFCRAAEVGDQLAAFGAISVLAGRETEADGVDIIRGNQMNLGVPSAA